MTRAALRIELTGKRFGRLIVRAYAGDRKWSCVCDCDAHHDARGSDLRKGRIKSCGCLRRELNKTRAIKHGMCGTPEYSSWTSMKQRCLYTCVNGFENYGGRGVTFCEEWRSFLAFFADMGERPPGCSLDRIDPNGNYEPGNCRWATALQQTHNRRPRRPNAAVKRRQPEPSILPLSDPPF
jgi:hypothetical protein